MQLANRRLLFGAVRDAVDSHRAHTANALAAVVVENDRLFTLLDKLFVQNIEHFQKRAVFADVIDCVFYKTTLVVGVFLSPNFKMYFHISACCVLFV